MHIHTQHKTTTQKKEAPSASSVLDASSQSEALQHKADMANSAAQRAEAPRPNNTGMPDNLKSGIESLSGFSMDDVRVHYNSSKPATVQALAYTQGTDIHVAPGQEKHLPHEAWHVAQQMAGRVSPTTNINGMPVNDNAALEHEADVMGEKAVQCKGMEYRRLFSFKKNNIGSASVQRKIKVGKWTWEDSREKIISLMRGNFESKYLFNIFFKDVYLKLPEKVKLDFYQKEVDDLNESNFFNTFILWLEEWGKSKEGKNSNGDVYTYEYATNRKDLHKLIKDVFKYHFFKYYNWRIIGVGEYMTGDSTGLGIAAALDPAVTLKILPYWASQTEKKPTFMEGGALDPTKTDVRFKNGIRSEDSLARERAPVLFRPLYDSSQIRISGLKKKENARMEAIAKFVIKRNTFQELWNMLKADEQKNIVQDFMQKTPRPNVNKSSKKLIQKLKDPIVKAVCDSYGIVLLGDINIIYNNREKIEQKVKDKIKSNIIEGKIQLSPELLTQTQIDQEREFQKLNPGKPNDVYRRRFVAAGRSRKAAPIKPWNMETYEATRIIGEKYGEKKEEIKPLLLPSKITVKAKVKLFKEWLFKKNNIETDDKCILLWQRRSGERGGAHKELDSHPIILKRIAKMISANFSDRVIILIGDKSICGADLGITRKTADFHEYWNLQMYKDLGLNNDRNNQNYFLQLLSDENDAISIGMRSGSLESSALLGIKTIFIDDLGNNAEDRMEFWAGNAAYGRKTHLKDEFFEQNLSGPIPNYKRLATSNCFTTSERDVFKYLDAIEDAIKDAKKDAEKDAIKDDVEDDVEDDSYAVSFGGTAKFDVNFTNDINSIFCELRKNIEKGNFKERCSEIAVHLEYVRIGQEHIRIDQEHIRIGQEYIRIGQEYIKIGQNHIGIGQEYIRIGQEYIKIGQNYIGIGQEEIELDREIIENEKKMSDISKLRQEEITAYTIASASLETLLWKLQQMQGVLRFDESDCQDMLVAIKEFRSYMGERVISDNELDQLAGLLSFWINSEKEPAAEGTDKVNHVDVANAGEAQSTDIVKKTES